MDGLVVTAPPGSTVPPVVGAPLLPGGSGPRAPRSRRWYAAFAAVGVAVVLATCGGFAYFLVQDELAGREALADNQAGRTDAPRDISSRDVDPDPLTVEEVFPEDEIVVSPESDPYQVLGTQDNDDCTTAAADDLADLLVDLGCSQVVRGTLRSPDGDYLITAGVFNLETRDDAERAYNDIDPLVNDATGRFLGLLAGDGTKPIVISETRVGWDFRGHFLIYALIARADGGGFGPADDKRADLIFWDVIELHLREGVLEQRATIPATDQAPVERASAEPAGEGGE